MDRPLLNDRDEFPDDEVLAKCLGRAKSVWDAFAAGVPNNFPDSSLEWRYYNDGKAWLCKVTRKKKTLCWISVWDKFFRISFYFMTRHDEGIRSLAISDDLKESYFERDSTGKLKPLVFEVKTKKALEDVFTVMKYKSSAK